MTRGKKDKSKEFGEFGKDNGTVTILKLLLDQQEKKHKAFESSIISQIKESFSTQSLGSF